MDEGKELNNKQESAEEILDPVGERVAEGGEEGEGGEEAKEGVNDDAKCIASKHETCNATEAPTNLPADLNSPVRIMHEIQESNLCGQHCLNNLLQQNVFDVVLLATLAQEFDEMERKYLRGTETMRDFGNVDETGNFGFAVLQEALHRYVNMELVSWTGEEGRTADPCEEHGFVINQNNHWFAIRKIESHWWNLDSLLEQPEHISSFYLSVLLGQFREDGCAVFLARGNLPPRGQYNQNNENGHTVWYDPAELLPTRKDPIRAQLSSAGPIARNGSSKRLFEDMNCTPLNLREEEEMLAKAIAASLVEHRN